MSVKEIIAKFEHPVVMALGNPLLDIILQNDTNYLCTKYNLAIDGQTELDDGEIEKLFKDLSNKPTFMSAGGSALNTVRMLQKLCGKKDGPKMCTFYGGVGIDARGQILKDLIGKANVDLKVAYNFEVPSGVCICIVNGANRSLVANIGAAAYFTLEDLNCFELPLDTVRIIYIEGFFITHSYEVAQEVIKKAQGKNIIVAFNLSGTYIFKDHHPAICQMVGQSKIVFGNAQEMMALANALDVEFESAAEIPSLLNKLTRVSQNASNSTSNDWLQSDIFVMTQGGSEPAIVVWGKEESAQVSPIKVSSIVDTTGAGDSLVAGFLAGVVSGKDPRTCLEWGCKAASKVITSIGATLPDDLPDNFLS